jgi:hypothetical protein
MLIFPVIRRELSAALRKQGSPATRVYAALAYAGLGSVFQWAAGPNETHFWLFALGVFYAVVRPIRFSSSVICAERRGQTLPLVFLAGVSPIAFFVSKIAGTTIIALRDLLGVFPFLALPFLTGTLSLDLYLATVAILPLLLLLSVSVSILSSSICDEDDTAQIGAWTILAVLAGSTTIPFYLGRLVSGTAPFQSIWLCLSPAYATSLVWTQFAIGTRNEFWLSAELALVWSLAALAVAARVFRRRSRAEPETADRWSWRGFLSRLARGTPAWRRHLASRVLDQNPFQWLALQDRRPIVLAWVILVGLLVLWTVAWAVWRAQWASTTTLFAAAIALIAALHRLANHASSRRIARERADGSLELLLASPLSAGQILAGQLDATREQFRTIRQALVAALLLMMIGGVFTRSWTPKAAVTYVIVWLLLVCWARRDPSASATMQFWFALNTGRTSRVALRLREAVGPFIWVVFYAKDILAHGISALPQFPTGSVPEVVFTVFTGVILLVVYCAYDGDSADFKARVISSMREIARQPAPDANDPRLEKWKDKTKALHDVE